MNPGSTAFEQLSQRTEAGEYELQCNDCYRIFPSETPPGDADCPACGSTDIVKW